MDGCREVVGLVERDSEDKAMRGGHGERGRRRDGRHKSDCWWGFR